MRFGDTWTTVVTDAFGRDPGAPTVSTAPMTSAIHTLLNPRALETFQWR
jgi:hypothetical protein